MPPPLTRDDLRGCLEHTLLKPEATTKDIEKLCAEAREHQLYAVCVNGSRVELASSLVADSGVKVVAVVAFPLGAMDTDVKRYETETAIDSGAHEIDVVLNIGRLKEHDAAFILRELRDIVEAADERPVKVILETGLLSRDEKILGCELTIEAGAQFVKTSTGFGGTRATTEDVRLLRETVGTQFGVKAAGGIKTFDAAVAMIGAGASRIGSSSSVTILNASPAN